MLHFLSINHLVVNTNEAHNCCVIRILKDVVGVEPWETVMSQQNEQQGAQNAALRGAGAHKNDTVDTASHHFQDREKMQQPVAPGCVGN